MAEDDGANSHSQWYVLYLYNILFEMIRALRFLQQSLTF